MKALTLTAPYATLIAIGAKHIETRSWATSYRGPLAIHQAAGLGPVGGKAGLDELCCSHLFFRALYDSGVYSTAILPRGAIVATCELIDCVQVLYEWPRDQVVSMRLRHILSDQERAFGDYSAGRWAWLLANVQALAEPIPAKGALGLWEWDAGEGTS